VHPNGSLIPGAQIKRSVQTGQAPIGEVLISNLANEDPLFGIDSVPFVATSYADGKKMWSVSRAALEGLLAKQGMKLLYAVPWPPQELYTNKLINTIADLKGLKFRAYNPATSRLAELAGMQPVKIELADLPQAMITGGIQAHITSSSGGCDTKAWETTKILYDTQGWLPKNMVFVNQKALDAVDKDSQAAIVTAAAAAEDRGWKMSEEGNKKCLELLASNGMQVLKPSPQLMSDLRKIGDTMAAEWAKGAGADAKAVLDAYKK
jgi:TRAP-type C4-dicarboxylate transport system substrate-binding protein